MQLKLGEIHASTETAAELMTPGGPTEVQHFGYAVMQHLVSRPRRCALMYFVHRGDAFRQTASGVWCTELEFMAGHLNMRKLRLLRLRAGDQSLG